MFCQDYVKEWLMRSSTAFSEGTLRRGVRCNQKVTKSNKNASDMKTARTVDFSTKSGLPPAEKEGFENFFTIFAPHQPRKFNIL